MVDSGLVTLGAAFMGISTNAIWMLVMPKLGYEIGKHRHAGLEATSS